MQRTHPSKNTVLEAELPKGRGLVFLIFLSPVPTAHIVYRKCPMVNGWVNHISKNTYHLQILFVSSKSTAKFVLYWNILNCYLWVVIFLHFFIDQVFQYKVQSKFFNTKKLVASTKPQEARIRAVKENASFKSPLFTFRTHKMQSQTTTQATFLVFCELL